MAKKAASQLENTWDADDINDPNNTWGGYDRTSGTPMSAKMNLTEQRKYFAGFGGTYDPSTNLPALTNATGYKGHWFEVLPLAAQQVRDFGSGNITFPARTPGLLVHNGTSYVWYPHNYLNASVEMPNNFPAVAGSPTTAEAQTYVTSNNIQGPTFLYYIGSGGTAADPKYVWAVDSLRNVRRTTAPLPSNISLPTGGTAGQFLIKTLPADYAASWLDLSSAVVIIPDTEFLDPANPTDTAVAVYALANGLRGPTLIIHPHTGTAANPDFAWYLHWNTAVVRVRNGAGGGGGGGGASQYVTLEKNGHGLTASDIGKPLFHAALWDDMSLTQMPTGIMAEYVNANVIRYAPMGVAVNAAAARFAGGFDHNATGPFVYWDLSAAAGGLWVATKPTDAHAKAMPLAMVNSLVSGVYSISQISNGYRPW